MQKNKIDELTEEEAAKRYEDEVKLDSYEKHSGMCWCSKRKAGEYGF